MEAGCSEPLVCERQVYQANVFRKLDLILQRDDGLEYDENGCMPCMGVCKKPVYEAGQSITGYLLVRPTKKIIITGNNSAVNTYWSNLPGKSSLQVRMML